uniref:Uncharacterized protein n=1 Tax=viral metagenome TaxID=1070528 RepID=A0A6C0IZT6_9ZZZZ
MNVIPVGQTSCSSMFTSPRLAPPPPCPQSLKGVSCDIIVLKEAVSNHAPPL